ncbi:hypothetical protein MKX03_031542, partial [Papaver bracteatum]
FMAGMETTGATMVAAISLLIDFYVGQGRFISDSDLPKLSYLQCVIQESLPLHPPAPIPAPHISSQDYTVSGYDIPRGSNKQEDPKWWDEPTKFNRISVMKEGKMDGMSRIAFRVTSLAIGGLIQCLEWKKADDSDKIIEEEGDEPSSRAMCRPGRLRRIFYLEFDCTNYTKRLWS